MFVEDALQLHTLDESVEQRQGPDIIGTEFEAVGLSEFAREDFFWFGAAWCGGRGTGDGFGFGHGGRPQEWPEGIIGRASRGPSGVGSRQDGKIFAEIMLLELWKLLLT
jgi:hypothetical protein